ncbi:MAG: AsmA-like C-terminal region-containing protein [Bacteroidota bacterium]|nr:AsmA-like C-terminal region-containing protein [Bacteroidota bacterium]
MKKFIKWFFRIFLSLLLLIIILLIVLPLFFKDDMLAKVKEEINNNVNAKVEFADFKLSLFKSFPDFNLGLHEMSVIGIDKFENDTLVYFQSFNVQVDLISVLKKNIVVKGIVLNQPYINAIVLSDSTANWEIAKPAEEVADTLITEEDTLATTEPMDYRVDLQKFQIKNAKLQYVDETGNLKATIDDLNFLLKGDLGMDYSDLTIETSVDAINVNMDGIQYLKNATLGFDATIGADLENMIFTFKENQLALNAIALGFDGIVEMLDEDITMDVQFNTKKTSFKSLLSMVPAIYMEGFESLKTEGKLALYGDIKGTYNENEMPLVNLKLLVEDAMFQYPDLPKSVDNINIDLDVFYDGVNDDQTKVDLNRFHVEMADNPFDIGMHIRTPFSDPYIEGSIDGHVILNTLADALPLDDMKLSGEIIADVDIAGNLSTIEKEQYEDFKATGKLQIKDFLLEGKDLPAAVKIIETTFNFTPQYLELQSLNAAVGKSDFQLTGKIENYISYALSDGTLKGDFQFNSTFINVNEFLPTDTLETEQSTTSEEVGSLEGETIASDSVQVGSAVVEIPENIDFKLESNLDHILYDKLDITHLTGTFLVKDKKLMMDNLNMDLLDGKFSLDGEYNTKDIEKPSATLALNIQRVEIEKVINSFSMLESLAPILKKCKGKVSIKFDFNSLIDSAMSPVLSTVNGYGRLQSNNIQVVDSKTFDKLAGLLNLGDKFNNEFKDVNISINIANGRIIVEPFETKVKDIKMVVGGSHGIDQTLDYNLALTVPRKYMGSTVNDAVEGLLAKAADKGISVDAGENINVKAKIIGTTTDPKITLGLKEGTQNVKEGLKEKAREEINKQKEELEDQVRKEAEERAQKIIDEAEAQAAKIKQEARTSADKLLANGKKEADALVEKAAKEGRLAKLAAQKVADELEKKAKQEADKLIKEADRRANNLVAKARVEADKIRNEQR